MAATSTETNLTTAKTVAASSTPTDPSLMSITKICTLCESVQPTSNEFSMFSESSPLPSQSPQLTVTKESETIRNTSLPCSMPLEVSTKTKSIGETCTSAHSSLSKGIETDINSAAVLPASTRVSSYFEPPQSSQRESSLIDSLKNCPKDLGFNFFLDELAAEITNEDLKRLKHYVIENGYKQVRFHLVSNEVVAFDRCQVHYVRTTVAEFLLVPPELLLVIGVEPSSSLVITLMMPEYYASLLIEMVNEYRIPQLLDVGIDQIYYDGKLYHLLGKTSKECIQGHIRGKYEDCEELLERLKRAETWLEQGEKEVIELRRLLDKAELDLQYMKKEKAESIFVPIITFQT